MNFPIILYVTGQKIRNKKVFPRHSTGSRSQKKQEKAVSFRKWSRKNSPAVSVDSLSHAQNWSWREPLLYLEFNKPNKQNVSGINLFLTKSTFLSVKTIVNALIDVRNETSKHHFSKSVKLTHNHAFRCMYDPVKTGLSESEAEAEDPTNRKARNRTLSLVYSSASACDSDNAVFTWS